jgi:hypothetical protein
LSLVSAVARAALGSGPNLADLGETALFDEATKQ